MTNEITIIQKEASPFITKAESLVISTIDDLTIAAEMRLQLSDITKRIENEKQKTLGPANETVKAIRAQWAPLEKMSQAALYELNQKISAYQTEQARLKKVADERIAARVGSGTGKLKAETAIKKMAENTIVKEIETNSGGLSFRTNTILIIDDASKIPVEFIKEVIYDEKTIKNALKNGVKIPGCHIEERQIPTKTR